MDNIAEIISVENAVLPIVAEGLPPIDLFNRQEVIDRIMKLLDVVSEKHSSCSFSLNGTWGSGKTFVLNRLMKQLLDYQDGEKYFVFHYNCWQYDYYEEPLVAIVAAMLDSVDEETHLFSKSLRQKARDGLAFAKPILKRIAKEFVEKKIGVDITDILELINAGAKGLASSNNQTIDAHEYDKYYSFKKAILSAQKGIRKLSEQRTVVVVVDELDRCLPSYATKVMERLHHLFSNLDNSAVILAVDKGQLEKTVTQIFGDETDCTKYLQKFIDFEISLNVGKVEGGFMEKYAEYFSLFDYSLIQTNFCFEDFCSALFSGIDPRMQEHLMSRIKTVHTMLFPKEKKDYSFACFELMWIVFSDIHGLTRRMPLLYDAHHAKQSFHMQDNVHPEFTAYLEKHWQGVISNSWQESFTNRRGYYLASPTDIPQLLIWYLYQMYPNPSIYYHLRETSTQDGRFSDNLTELKEVVELLKIIK